MVNVLIVTSNRKISGQASAAIQELGYLSVGAAGYEQAMDALLEKHFDMIVADMAWGGCELCLDLREAGNAVPCIVLAEKITQRDKRIIFRAKADGYLEVPFDSEELQMRIKNLLWRCHIETSAEIRYGNCRLNTDNFSVECGEHSIDLRHMEFLLLEKLLSYPGRIFTRAQLMDDLWGYECQSDPRTVDAHIRQLRKKLRMLDAIKIQTIRGIGYRAAIPK